MTPREAASLSLQPTSTADVISFYNKVRQEEVYDWLIHC